MAKIKSFIDTVLKYLSIIIFGATAVLVIYQVFTRYVLNSPSSWSETAVTYGFIWLAMICGAYVFGQSEHMNMTFIRDKFPKKIQVFIEMISECFVAFLATGVMLIGGYYGAIKQMGQKDATLGIPVGIVYMIIPFAGACIIFYFINKEINLIKELTVLGQAAAKNNEVQ